MAAVGVEELGVEEFVQGKYFDGDVYVDTKKQTYRDLGFKRLGFKELLSVIFARKTKEAVNQAKKEKISGNLKGDGYQNGGLLIVKPGGEVLLDYKQPHPADMISIADVCKALGLSAPEPSAGAASGAPNVVCDENACKLEK